VTERSGFEKAAILIISLGPKLAAPIYRHLNEHQIEMLTAEVARLGRIGEQEKREVLEEFFNLTMSQGSISEGGLELAQEILDSALGKQKANAIIGRLLDFSEGTSFEMLRKADPLTAANMLKKEHPQTIAIVLAHMDSRQMGPVLAKLPDEIRGDVAYRIATLERPNPDVIKVMDEVFNSTMAEDIGELARQRGGSKKMAEALNEIDRDTWVDILDDLEGFSKEVALDVRNQMFIFEDIMILDDKSVQELLKNIDSKELAVALKATSDGVRDKIFNNMSKRAGEGIKEDIEYMGPIRLSDVEEAQQRIVDVLRRLEEEGSVTIGRAGSGAVMVE
jgi:flagellar motor switch protein FliG